MRMTIGVVATASKREHAGGDRRALVAQLVGRLAIDRRDGRQGEVQLPVRVHPPCPELIAGRLAGARSARRAAASRAPRGAPR